MNGRLFVQPVGGTLKQERRFVAPSASGPGRAPSTGAADGVPRPRPGGTWARPGSWGQPVNWGLTLLAPQRLKLSRSVLALVPLDLANSTFASTRCEP
jgi:hypothetical protein